MKRLLTLHLCLLLLANYRSTKEVNRVTTTTQDSTTTITQRHIQLVLAPDSLRDTMSVQAFTDSFRVAKVGHVFKQKASAKGNVKYALRKTSHHDFEVEAISAAKDTTVTVSDTLTRIRTKQLTTITLEKQPTVFQKAWTGVKDFILWILLFLVLLCGSYVCWSTRK